MSRHLVTEVTTVGAVRACQAIWVPWMAEACYGLSDDDAITTTTEVTPFGRYLLAISQEKGKKS